MAYARHFTRPRPYIRRDPGHAGGMAASWWVRPVDRARSGGTLPPDPLRAGGHARADLSVTPSHRSRGRTLRNACVKITLLHDLPTWAGSHPMRYDVAIDRGQGAGGQDRRSDV